MPSTRKQAAHNTRSTGSATHPLGIQKKGKRNVSDSFSRETPTPAQSDRSDNHWARFDLLRSLGNRAYHWTNKVLEIACEIYFWFLSKRYPVVNIIAEKFRGTYPRYTVLVTSVILMAYAFDFWQLICHVIFPAAVSPGIYHIDVLRPPQHPWIKREEEVSIVMEGIKRLSEVRNRKEIHVYFKGGPGSGKSELARQVALSLNESQKQSRRPSAVIAIQADNVSRLLSSLWDAIKAVVRDTRDPRIKVEDIRKEIDDEYKFEMFLTENEEDQVQKTRNKLKVLCSKLVKLLENISFSVLIFDNVHDLEVLNSLNLKPGNDHLATFVIIFTLQQNASLDRLPRDYVHVQDLSQGKLSLNDSVKLLKSFFPGCEGDHSYTELSNILGCLSPLELSRTAIFLKGGGTLHLVQVVHKIRVVHQLQVVHKIRVVHEIQVVHVLYNCGNRTNLVKVIHLVQVRHIVQVEHKVQVVHELQIVHKIQEVRVVQVDRKCQ